MSLEALAVEAKQFARSSSYQYGDRTSFGVRLTNEILLPGKCSAAKYLDDLGLDKVPERVMVVCPGNGGLVTECFLRGAKFVLVCETRPRFEQGIQGVLRLLTTAWRLENKHKLTHQRIDDWPEVGREQGFADMDLILWSEGVDEITFPKKIFRGVADCLSPGGRLIVEINHGTNKWVEEINSWRPNGHAVLDMVDEIFGTPPETSAGRLSTSRIYTLTLPGKAPAKKKKKKPAAKKKKKKKKKPALKKVGPARPLPLGEPKLDPEAPRHVHVDLAVDDSRTGIKTTTGDALEFDDRPKLQENVEKALETTTVLPPVKVPKAKAKKKRKKKAKRPSKTGL